MTLLRGRRGPDPVPLVDRFWQHVDTSGGPDACHPWTRSRNAAGYGRVGGEPESGGPAVELAHRVAWRLTHPGEPMPTVVRHTCDNPPCCNVLHLLGGTQADNVADCVERSRLSDRQGEAHPRAVLTEVVVRRIIALRADRLTYDQIVDATGATRSQVADIVTGRTWQNVPRI